MAQAIVTPLTQALAEKLLASQGRGQSATFGGAGEEIQDFAGNVAQSASCGNLNIDFTAPTISCDVFQGTEGKNGPLWQAGNRVL